MNDNASNQPQMPKLRLGQGKEQITQVFRVMSVKYEPGDSKRPKSRFILQNANYIELPAIHWLNVYTFKEGDVVQATGLLGEYRKLPQLEIITIEVTKKFDLKDLLPKTSEDISQLEKRLNDCLMQIKDQNLQTLATSILDPFKDLGKNFRLAPASSSASSHEAYLHGLLQHSLEVTELSISLCLRMHACRPDKYGKINLDFIIFAALFHDIGKVFAYLYGNKGIKKSKTGELNAHLIKSCTVIEPFLIGANCFSEDEITLIMHIIASHHGPNSDVPPKTPEAIIVHAADDICSQLGSYGKRT